VTRDGAWLAVRPVLAPTRPQQQERGERTRRADEVDDGRAGEVLHAEARLKPPAAEDPVREHRVDDRGEDDRIYDVGAELDPLERRAPDDGQGDRAEDELEEEQRGRADRVGLEQRDLARGLLRCQSHVEEEAVRARDRSRAAEGEREADRPVGDRRDREVGEDLGDPRARVLRAREADLEEGEARLHEHHEDGRDHHPGRVELDHRLVERGLVGGERRGGERERRPEGERRSAQEPMSHRGSSSPPRRAAGVAVGSTLGRVERRGPGAYVHVAKIRGGRCSLRRGAPQK
jgi:hypothetical protein